MRGKSVGAHRITVDGVAGVHFAVWAPNADRVSVIGDFNRWDGRVHVMRPIASSGVWELFIPELTDGACYKYEVRTRAGHLLEKADPYGLRFEVPPNSASVIWTEGRYQWGDEEWLRDRPSFAGWHDRPMSIYEVHLGSWKRVPEEGNRYLSYRELADTLVPYVRENGLHAHRVDAGDGASVLRSWGYQVIGFFAPTSRFAHPTTSATSSISVTRHGVGCDPRLGARPLPEGSVTASRSSTAPALYEHCRSASGRAQGPGNTDFNTGATKCVRS